MDIADSQGLARLHVVRISRHETFENFERFLTALQSCRELGVGRQNIRNLFVNNGDIAYGVAIRWRIRRERFSNGERLPIIFERLINVFLKFQHRADSLVRNAQKPANRCIGRIGFRQSCQMLRDDR